LPDNPIRIGTVMDMIEGYILKIDDQSDMTYAQYTLLGSSNILMIDDRRIELTQTEKAIIATLMQAGIDGLDRDALLKMVWNYRSDLDTHTLETHIYRLRQKIEQDPTNPHYLCTIPNGYRLS
jgi:DNA-binding response OmpR family regulator